MSRVELTPGVPPHQPLTAVELANYLGIGLGIVVLALVLYTAIFYRERLLDPTARSCSSRPRMWAGTTPWTRSWERRCSERSRPAGGCS